MTHAPMPKPSAGRSTGQGPGPRGGTGAAKGSGGAGKGGGKDGGNRRDRLASFEKARKAERRRRTILLLAVCVVVAAALLAYPVYLVAKDSKVSAAGLAAVGVTSAAAGCDPDQANTATGNQDHVAEGTKVQYAQSPPDSGKHYPSPATFTKHFYSADDRPEIETLVHNLEHGYTIAWYRADAPESDVDRPAPGREHLRQRDLRPVAEVHRGPVLEHGRHLPGRQERRPRPLDRRPGQPQRPDPAAGRQPGLRGRQRPGHLRLHGQVPGRELARAERSVTWHPPDHRGPGATRGVAERPLPAGAPLPGRRSVSGARRSARLDAHPPASVREGGRRGTSTGRVGAERRQKLTRRSCRASR